MVAARGVLIGYADVSVGSYTKLSAMPLHLGIQNRVGVGGMSVTPQPNQRTDMQGGKQGYHQHTNLGGACGRAVQTQT